MERGYLSLIIALVLGSAVGSVLAVDIFSATFWWAGALIGGVVGYLTCGWRQILPAIKRAWIYARNEVPYGKYLKLGVLNIIRETTMWMNFTLMLCVILWWNDEKLQMQSILTPLIAGVLFGITFGIILGMGRTITVEKNDLDWQIKDTGKSLFTYFLPLFLPLVALRLSFKLLVGGGTLVARFFSKLYLEIRGSQRNLCFLSCATGATIAHFWGHALIGTVAGLLVGLALHRLVYKPVEATKAH